MKDEWNIRSMRDSEAAVVAKLVTKSFMAQVAPLYGHQGVDTFSEHAAAPALLDRRSRGSEFIVAEAQGVLIGMAELRGESHLAMLFVADQHQRRGIGRALVRAIVRECSVRYPSAHTITVNSAPNSVGAYLGYGFSETGPERERDGVRFVPMRMSLAQENTST